VHYVQDWLKDKKNAKTFYFFEGFQFCCLKIFWLRFETDVVLTVAGGKTFEGLHFTSNKI
jgi:hypothetical protein